MLRSLVWKEWREQRSVAIAGTGLAIAMPVLIFGGLGLIGGSQRLADVVTLLPIANWTLLWPLAAVATAAAAVTAEMRDARLAFILSRPVSRTTLLAVKLAVAGLVAVAIIAAGQATAALLIWWMAPASDPAAASGSAGQPAPAAAPVGGDLGAMEPLLLLGIVAFAALCFAFAVLVSLILPRALHVIPVAALLATGVFGGNFMLWYYADYVPVGPAYMTAWPALLAVALLAAAFISFRRGELLRGWTHAARTGGIAAATLLIWGMATAAMAAYEMRPPTGEVVFERVVTSTDGNHVAAIVARADRAASRTVGVLDRNGNLALVDKRISTNPAFSPDGTQVAYVSRANVLGLRTDGFSLQLRDLATGHEETLAVIPGARMSEPGFPKFSPDGEHIAIDLNDVMVVARTDNARPARTVPRRPSRDHGTRFPHCRLVGWSVREQRILRSCGSSDGLVWLDLADLKVIHRLVAPPGVSRHVRGVWDRKGQHSALIIADQVRGESRGSVTAMRHYSLDVHSKEMTLLVEEPGRWLSTITAASALEPRSTSAVVAYSRPSRSRDSTSIYLRYVDSGDDVLLAEQPNTRAWARVELSPGARWLLARTETVAEHSEERASQNVAYNLETGETQQVGGMNVATWYDPAWAGEDGIAYLDERIQRPASQYTDTLLHGWSREIRMLDLTTGEDSRLYPPEQ